MASFPQCRQKSAPPWKFMPSSALLRNHYPLRRRLNQRCSSRQDEHQNLRLKRGFHPAAWNFCGLAAAGFSFSLPLMNRRTLGRTAGRLMKSVLARGGGC